METIKPPPIIAAGLRVLEYAVIAEPVRFTGNLQLYVEGALLGEVPRLAICESLDDAELFLCHCDDKLGRNRYSVLEHRWGLGY